LAFGGTRTYQRMAVAIEDAGFEIRDSIHWLYGSGFPKSHNIAKAIGKLNDSRTDDASRWTGWGTALKPAHEPIVVARRPLSGTVAATVLEHGTGALNIDGCRIGTDDTLGRASGGWQTGGYVGGDSPKWDSRGTTVEGGRWPANLVLTHAADCAEDCAPDCPVAEIDRQSGDSTSVTRSATNRDTRGTPGFRMRGIDATERGHNDTGGASRFFAVTEWDPTADVAPFRYEAKPSRAERDAGLAALPEQLGGSLAGGDDKKTGKPQLTARQNHHPTVKPIALMRWLVRLVTPPGGTVLEPFAGSGTTMAAAILEDRHVIGCELTADYLPIIEGRIAWAHQQRNQTPATLFDEDPQ
jgi:site-specific DNA-methyltransferase (adenine-specific)